MQSFGFINSVQHNGRREANVNLCPSLWFKQVTYVSKVCQWSHDFILLKRSAPWQQELSREKKVHPQQLVCQSYLSGEVATRFGPAGGAAAKMDAERKSIDRSVGLSCLYIRLDLALFLLDT